MRTFHINNTASRYTLRVQRQGSLHNDGQVEINVNGTDWIKEQDFHGQMQVIQRNSLLLNANNSLRVRLKGKEGLTVKVTLLEGGKAGTILRRQDHLGMPGETQATHTRQNDTNIFDPNDVGRVSGKIAGNG